MILTKIAKSLFEKFHLSSRPSPKDAWRDLSQQILGCRRFLDFGTHRLVHPFARNDNFQTRSSGFTLIELLIVVSIIGILSVLGIAGFREYNEIQILQGATKDVATMLNQAKSRALSQVKLRVKPGEQCQPPRTLKGYHVVITRWPNNTAPFIRYRLKIGCVDAGGTDYLYALVDKLLPKNITFAEKMGFFFPVLTGGVTETETGDPPPWTIVLSGYGHTRRIEVNPVGGIKVQ